MARIAFAAVALALLCAAPASARVSADTAALQVALRAKGLYGGSGRRRRRAGHARRGARAAGAPRARRRRRSPGPRTRRALGRRGRPRLGSRALSAPARGWDVAALQFLLARHGFPSGPVDGGLGPRTDAALRRFQAWAGLGADGVAGPATLAALRRAAAALDPALPGAARASRRPTASARAARMFHTGLDFPAPAGTPVVAAGRGCVESVGWHDGYGRLVVIRHRLGMTSWYAHLSRIDVPRGRCVVAGDRIGARRLDRPLDRPAPALRAAPARRRRRPAHAGSSGAAHSDSVAVAPRSLTHWPIRPRKWPMKRSCSCAGYVSRTVRTSSAVELRRGDPLEHELVDVGEPGVAEVAVAVDLEVLVGQLAVGGELLLVGEVLAVADLEVAPGVEVQPRLAAGDRAERAPLQQRAHRPREVVVQARQRDVGRRVGVVDRVRLGAAHERLAGVELPAEERVDQPRDRQRPPRRPRARGSRGSTA